MNIWERALREADATPKTPSNTSQDWKPEVPSNSRTVLGDLKDDELHAVLSALFMFRDDQEVQKSQRDIVAKVLAKISGK